MQVRRKDWYRVNLYHVDRCYGGPEEGGWWYDVGRFVRAHSFEFDDKEEAYARCRQLNKAVSAVLEREGLYGIDSVLSEGWLYWYVEDHDGQDFPETRPHYC